MNNGKFEIPKKFLNSIINHLINLSQKINYLYIYYYYSNRKHLEIKYEKFFKITFTWYTHPQYLQHKKEILRKARAKFTPKEFIKFSLLECKHCNFIDFYCESRYQCISFWMGDRKIMAYWRITKNSLNKKHKYSMLGVLNELGIHEYKKGMKKPKNISYYELKEADDKFAYIITFQKDLENAAAFTSIMLEKVFKNKIEKISTRIG